MEKDLFVRAEEVARELGISKPYAYKLVREMNEELKKNVWRVGAFWSCFAFFTDLFSVFLNCTKQFIANDRFMGAFGNNKIIFSSLDLLMIYNLCFSLHQIACIDFAF